MNNSNIHLISYGDNVYKNSKVRLFNEATHSKSIYMNQMI